MTQPDEEYIINILKKSPDMNPSIEFVHKTRQELKYIVNNNRNKAIHFRKYLISSGLTVSLILITWITFFSGIHQMNTAIHAGLNIINPKQTVITEAKNEPLVFIYHTHNRESFVPELQSISPEEAQSIDINKNITSVGKHLSEKLEDFNIKALVDRTDYASEPNFSYKDSYRLSRETMVSAIKSNPALKMVFDIHRSSLPREKTTTKINGIDIAKIQFVVSISNKHYQENIKFASKLHDQLESLYQGLSSQVTLKDAPTESSLSYNQDLFPNSLLVEIGGPENSLEEEYRAVDLLSKAIADLTKE
ncbi:stage II sporulation protein P [Paenibacillus sp. V4I9]|uniref:stage II sporulation protein P n=1 Tax=Paenibacillus sp. V4I9 TaxID=3042308 RepID=UPI00277EAFA5|nr:stage II sporulation protein P [Paenibacillus sp. V4I9]MDQ0888783.1 stage II sporulation protein P [Paenibacillus sp. V4I9]